MSEVFPVLYAISFRQSSSRKCIWRPANRTFPFLTTADKLVPDFGTQFVWKKAGRRRQLRWIKHKENHVMVLTSITCQNVTSHDAGKWRKSDALSFRFLSSGAGHTNIGNFLEWVQNAGRLAVCSKCFLLSQKTAFSNLFLFFFWIMFSFQITKICQQGRVPVLATSVPAGDSSTMNYFTFFKDRVIKAWYFFIISATIWGLLFI